MHFYPTYVSVSGGVGWGPIASLGMLGNKICHYACTCLGCYASIPWHAPGETRFDASAHGFCRIPQRPKNTVTASVRGRVGDDIAQCQDDKGVSETAVIYTFSYFWKKHLVQIPWKGHFKSGKSNVLQARNRSFVRRGFRRRFLFSFQAQSCLRLFRTLPLTLLRQTASTFNFF